MSNIEGKVVIFKIPDSEVPNLCPKHSGMTTIDDKIERWKVNCDCIIAPKPQSKSNKGEV